MTLKKKNKLYDLEYDESEAFLPYCYNCAEYNTKDMQCKLKSKEVEPMASCVSFNERSNYNEAQIEELTKDQKTKEKKAEKEKDKKYNYMGDNIMIEQYQKNAELFWINNQFFFDKGNIFWVWNHTEKKYEMVDDTDMMNLLDDVLGFKGQTVNSRLKTQYLEAFKRVGRKHIPKDAPKKWVQFKDKAFSLSSGDIYDVTPDYFFTNPIPWELGSQSDTPTMDKLITEWVGEKYLKTAYEIIAYCCYSDYPIHMIFCLIGCGRNGKSKFLGLINKFIGKENICSTELDNLLDSRFETAKLYRKLICSLGETNFGTISKTSLLKKLTGQDLIGFEFKNKTPFDDYNYAKILIASNSLPSSDDSSEGFYRRWLILDFPNIFKEGRDILKDISDEEYSNLAKKVTEILPTLVSCGKFTNQGEIKERRERYIMASNPLTIFIKESCVIDDNEYVKQGELYSAYLSYLKNNKRRRVKLKEFKAALEEEGYWIEKENKKVDEGEWKSARWVNGIGLKTNWRTILASAKSDDLDSSSTQIPIYKSQVETLSQKNQMSPKAAEEFVE